MNSRRGIKLFVFDFDGTALGGHVPYEQFPRHFARLLDRLAEKGIRWATNTTWSPRVQFPLIIQSGVKSKPAFLTGGTGWLFATIKGGRLKWDEDHTKKMERRRKRFNRKNLPQVRRIFLDLLNADLVERFCFSPWNQSTISLSFKKKHSRAVWRLVAPLLESGEYYSFGEVGAGTSIDLMPKFMNKGEVMKELLRRLRVKPENVIVAGDGTNDLHMFEPRYAKWMVCPANAAPAVKEKVRSFGGIVSRKKYSWGVADGVRKILSALT